MVQGKAVHIIMVSVLTAVVSGRALSYSQKSYMIWGTVWSVPVDFDFGLLG